MKTKRHCFSFRFRDTMTFGGTELETMKCCEHIFYRFLESWLFIRIIFFTNQSGTLFFIDIPRFLISRNATKPHPVSLKTCEKSTSISTRKCNCALKCNKHKHKKVKKRLFYCENCNLGQNGWKIKTTPPSISMMEKMARFLCSVSTSLNLGEGCLCFSFYSVQDCGLK